MAWTAPRTWVVGEIVTAAQMNTHLRDNLNSLGNRGDRHTGTTSIERWYAASAVASFSPVTKTISVGTFYASPFATQRGGTIDRIAFEVTALAASGVARVGIYRATSETNIYPSALIVDSGEVSTATTGIKSFTISTALAPNVLHWATILTGTAAPVVRAIPWSATVPILGVPATAWTAMSGGGLFASQSYGALPSTFPGSPTIETDGTPQALIAVRYSA